jgi:hypothetical protein
MARKPAGKPGKPPREKIQLSLPAATAKRLRIAAAELGVDLSELVADLIDTRFAGVHVRGMNGTADQQQGSTPAAGGGVPSVAIPSGIKSTTNRIGKIAESSTAPVDEAIDSFQTESELITDHSQN